MTTKLFVNMLNVENKIRTFPIADYKVPFSLAVLLKINKILGHTKNNVPRQDKLTFLNISYNKHYFSLCLKMKSFLYKMLDLNSILSIIYSFFSL
jgi:hypothetical protein